MACRSRTKIPEYKFHSIFLPCKCITYIEVCTRWFKYDRDKLWLVYTQIVPVMFEPPCITDLLDIFIFVVFATTGFGLETRPSSGSYVPFQRTHPWCARDLSKSRSSYLIYVKILFDLQRSGHSVWYFNKCFKLSLISYLFIDSNILIV
jgi:hypothetical protein